MNTKEFVTKIIKKNQDRIIQKVKTMPKLLSGSFISILTLLPLTSMPNRGITAYAQQTQLQTTSDPWYLSLEMARSKVQAAMSPGAFGHGVPELHNLTTSDFLMALGISVLTFLVVFMAVRALPKNMNIGKIGRVLLPNK